MNESNRGIGQYDLEYKNCNCFWGKSPGKYVKNVLSYIQGGSALDLGAGEGKNAIYLAKNGFTVDAVEISSYAIENFNSLLSESDRSIQARIRIEQSDVRTFSIERKYDLVIGYGLLHCLDSLNTVSLVIDKMKSLTEKGGYIVLVAFNDSMPVPDIQSYLEPTLLPVGLLEQNFMDWRIVEYEDDVITETHPTSNIEHQHGVTRIIAQNITNGEGGN